MTLHHATGQDVFFVGLGDEFDDDRRFARHVPPVVIPRADARRQAPGPEIPAPIQCAGPPVHWDRPT